MERGFITNIGFGQLNYEGNGVGKTTTQHSIFSTVFSFASLLPFFGLPVDIPWVCRVATLVQLTTSGINQNAPPFLSPTFSYLQWPVFFSAFFNFSSLQFINIERTVPKWSGINDRGATWLTIISCFEFSLFPRWRRFTCGSDFRNLGHCLMVVSEVRGGRKRRRGRRRSSRRRNRDGEIMHLKLYLRRAIGGASTGWRFQELRFIRIWWTTNELNWISFRCPLNEKLCSVVTLPKIQESFNLWGEFGMKLRSPRIPSQFMTKNRFSRAQVHRPSNRNHPLVGGVTGWGARTLKWKKNWKGRNEWCDANWWNEQRRIVIDERSGIGNNPWNGETHRRLEILITALICARANQSRISDHTGTSQFYRLSWGFHFFHWEKATISSNRSGDPIKPI